MRPSTYALLTRTAPPLRVGQLGFGDGPGVATVQTVLEHDAVADVDPVEIAAALALRTVPRTAPDLLGLLEIDDDVLGRFGCLVLAKERHGPLLIRDRSGRQGRPYGSAMSRHVVGKPPVVTLL